MFRSLPILVEAGILQPAPPSGEARRFELALGREHHDHLRCRGCGRIVEFRSEEIERLQLEIARAPRLPAGEPRPRAGRRLCGLPCRPVAAGESAGAAPARSAAREGADEAVSRTVASRA